MKSTLPVLILPLILITLLPSQSFGNDKMSELSELLKGVSGITTQVIGSRFVIEGEIGSLKDYRRIQTIAHDKAYEETVLNLSELSDAWLEKRAQQIEEDIHMFAPHVTARVSHHHVVLEGWVENLDNAKRASLVASMQLPNEWPEKGRAPASAADDKNCHLLTTFIQIMPLPKKGR